MGNASATQSSGIQNKARGNPAWTAGVSGNPGGRPVHKPLSNALRELLAVPAGTLPKGWDAKALTGAQDLASRTLDLARTGSHQHAVLVWDRAEGKPPLAQEDRDAIAASGAALDPLLALYGVAH